MNIKREKNKQARIVLPPDSRYHIKTPDHLFEHHVIFCAVGPRGASKTTKICNYLRMMRQANKLDRLLIVSPTVKSNQALLDSLGVRPEDCFEPTADATKKVLAVVNEERDCSLMNFKALVGESDTAKVRTRGTRSDRLALHGFRGFDQPHRE